MSNKKTIEVGKVLPDTDIMVVDMFESETTNTRKLTVVQLDNGIAIIGSNISDSGDAQAMRLSENAASALTGILLKIHRSKHQLDE